MKTGTEACHEYDSKMLATEMKDKVKCSKILKEGYGRKQYSARLIPNEVREYFATRVQMIPIAGNFSRDNRFRGTGGYVFMAREMNRSIAFSTAGNTRISWRNTGTSRTSSIWLAFSGRCSREETRYEQRSKITGGRMEKEE